MNVLGVRRFLLLAAAAVFSAVAVASLVKPHLMARQIGYELASVDALSEFRAIYVGLWLATAVLLVVAALRVHSLLLGDLGALLILGQTLGRVLSLVIDGVPSASILVFFVLESVGGAAILVTRPRTETAAGSRPLWTRAGLAAAGVALCLLGQILFALFCADCNAHLAGAWLGALGGAALGLVRKAATISWFGAAGGTLLAVTATAWANLAQGTDLHLLDAMGAGLLTGLGVGLLADAVRGPRRVIGSGL